MIFVIAEHKDNNLKSITSELLVFAQRAGRDFGQPVTAVVLGASTAALVEELKGRSAAAGLVMGKISRTPAAIIRGLA